MKSHFPPIEVDLYVVNKPLTDKDRKEIVEFLENYKRKQKLKAKRALTRKRTKTKA